MERSREGRCCWPGAEVGRTVAVAAASPGDTGPSPLPHASGSHSWEGAGRSQRRGEAKDNANSIWLIILHVLYLDFRRQIDFTGWDLVFTTHGRYFFFDTVEGGSVWRPPSHLLEYLQELPPSRLENLFDSETLWKVEGLAGEGFHGELDEQELADEPDYICPSDNDQDRESDSIEALEPQHASEGALTEPSLTTARPPDPAKPRRPPPDPEAQQRAIEAFKQIFLDLEDLDPFASWDSIRERAAADLRFQGIPTERERKALFESLCPVLAERARKIREARKLEAEQQWDEILSQLTLARAPATWTEFSRGIKKQPFYRLLDPKIMERQYRDRVAHLRARSTVYQIPK